MIEPNPEEGLARIQKDVEEMRDLLKQQNRSASYYFLYGIGMALIGIGLSVLSMGAALSRPWFVIAGITILSVGLFLLLFHPALHLANRLSTKKRRPT